MKVKKVMKQFSEKTYNFVVVKPCDVQKFKQVYKQDGKFYKSK